MDILLAVLIILFLIFLLPGLLVSGLKFFLLVAAVILVVGLVRSLGRK